MASLSGESTLAPRVLIVMPDQWPRALLRAALREEGYDAVGTRNIDSALRIRPDEADRGPVRLVVVDQAALKGAADKLEQLLARYHAPSTLLLARPTLATPAGPWDRVLQRPVSVAEILNAAEKLVPLSPEDRHPLD
jgi:DNA-binding response OmpR family regulator